MLLKPVEPWWFLPKSLTQVNQWVLRGGKDNKMPINPATQKPAEVSNPATWGTFDQVRHSKNIGFELLGYIGIDFDHIYKQYFTLFCLWAQEWVQKFAAKTYVEFSPSGTGCHVIGKGNFFLGEKDLKEIFDFDSPLVKKNTRMEHDVNALIVTPQNQNGAISGGRYFTITGNVIGINEIGDITDLTTQFYKELLTFAPKTPVKTMGKRGPTVANDTEILTVILRARNHEKFERFLRGDTMGYPSTSEAEIACARLIAFYTQDPCQIERIMRRTGFNREKWDKHKTYLTRTIERALDSVTEHYQSKSK